MLRREGVFESGRLVRRSQGRESIAGELVDTVHNPAQVNYLLEFLQMTCKIKCQSVNFYLEEFNLSTIVKVY